MPLIFLRLGQFLPSVVGIIIAKHDKNPKYAEQISMLALLLTMILPFFRILMVIITIQETPYFLLSKGQIYAAESVANRIYKEDYVEPVLRKENWDVRTRQGC